MQLKPAAMTVSSNLLEPDLKDDWLLVTCKHRWGILIEESQMKADEDSQDTSRKKCGRLARDHSLGRPAGAPEFGCRWKGEMYQNVENNKTDIISKKFAFLVNM